jgi:hypothetical protein
MTKQELRLRYLANTDTPLDRGILQSAFKRDDMTDKRAFPDPLEFAMHFDAQPLNEVRIAWRCYHAYHQELANYEPVVH